MSGFVKIPSDGRPDRAIHIDGVKMYWPPVGLITSAEAARRLGLSDNNLRAMRNRTSGEDRGPDWIVAPNGHSVAYVPGAVAAYIKMRAQKLRSRADEMLARVADDEQESTS